MDTATMLSNFKTRYATKYAGDTINTLDMSFIKRFQDSTSYTKDKELIEYPEFDRRGYKNILYSGNTTFTGAKFGVACVVNRKGLNIKVELLNADGSDVDGYDFGFPLSLNIGWIISQPSVYIPTYESDGLGTYDIYTNYTGMNPFPYGQHRVNIYYNNFTIPKEVRYIDLLE